MNIQASRWLFFLKVLVVLFVLLPAGFLIYYLPANPDPGKVSEKVVLPDTLMTGLWSGPADWRLTRLAPDERQLILYGKDLIAHTSTYFGPKGRVRSISNGMNCQNCHLQAGSQPWGNNYFGVQATYPKFRERSGTLENQVKRINDCFERSLNGRRLDSTGKEMRAILAYIRWLGNDVPKDIIPKGTGIYKLKPLERAADPEKGKLVYQTRCSSCHKENGEGLSSPDVSEYIYPPLWGNNSYNTGAGLFRISGFAGYVKLNMPLGTTYQKPLLSDEEAWDVAAFVNSQPRPQKDLSQDWPNLAGKPFDHPFGPYADPFPEEQHKYGPFKPIQEWKKKNKNLNVKNPLISTL